ncbi:MAG: glycosyltransferase [Bacteroidia bacterium]|jgi:uncharacterized protein (TIGR00661 family)|nr:glycosyltransferase [Bacteroidia bacterium]
MNLENKKCLFLVQGEGRGHMTQSISMKQVLESVGMEVCEVIIGKSDHREIPSFYAEKMKVRISTVHSPNMALDKKNKKVKPFATSLKSAIWLPQYFKSLRVIHQKVKEHKPDIIVNFFEPLCGFYSMFYKSSVPIVSVAHHYMFLHSDYKMPKGYAVSSASLKFYTWLTSFGSKKRLALSFYPFEDDLRRSIYIVPPLLRKEVLNYPTSNDNYLLVYLLNSGYCEEIIAWHRKNPDTEIHCFTDKKDMPESEQFDANLTFHRLNDQKFLSLMANSKGVVTTSGFETVNEAMFMGKPVFLIPVEGHYEQFCNSQDALRTNLCMFGKKFEISKFLDYIDNFNSDNTSYSDWVKKSGEYIVRNIYGLINKGGNVKQLYPESSAKQASRLKVKSI